MYLLIEITADGLAIEENSKAPKSAKLTPIERSQLFSLIKQCIYDASNSGDAGEPSLAVDDGTERDTEPAA